MYQLVDVILVLILGSAVSWLSLRVGIPNAVAQVVLGVLLGAAVLGWVEHSPLLHGLGEVGVVLLLGVAGLEIGLDRLKAAGWSGIFVAILGIVLTVTAGYAMGWSFGSPSDESLYIGLALGATSIGMTVQVLQQYGLVGQRAADTIIAAAVIDDVIVLYLLGAAHGFLSTGLSLNQIVVNALLALLVLAGLFALCRMATRKLERLGLISNQWIRGTWILIVIALGSLITHTLELSSVVGAFFAGMGLGEGLDDKLQADSVESLTLPTLIMMPFFFVMIGVQAEWNVDGGPNMTVFVGVAVIISVVAKALAGLLGAGRNYSWPERWLIGFGMVPRGEVGLVIVTLGLAQGHLSEAMFAALVATIIIVSAIGPVAMVPAAHRVSRTTNM